MIAFISLYNIAAKNLIRINRSTIIAPFTLDPPVFSGCTDFGDGSLIPITNPNFLHYIDNNVKDADPLRAFCGTGYDITLNRKAVYVIYDVIEFSLVELSFDFFGAAQVSVAMYLENDVIRTYKVRFW